MSDTGIGSCGSSCSPCAVPANAMPTCSGGTCGFTCNAGYADCDGDSSNGCETNLQTAVNHCGACATNCSFANAGATCSAGRCALGGCNAGYANCDGVATNGCEASLSSTTSCGMCGTACPTGMTCSGGSCVSSSCAPGTGNCDGNTANGCETSLSSDPNNCGSCGNRCAFANASPVCSSGTCTRGACASGFGDCDGNPTNGCETSTGTDPNNCGSCGTTCSYPGGTGTCSGGSCALSGCSLGRADCDGNPANGCETDTNGDPNNCGTCGMRCAATNGTPGCASGTCSISGCNAGYANCNGLVADGCESRIDSDPANCGACGHACATFGTDAVSCTASTCVPTCDYTHADCDGNPANGCETDITAPDHCGSCTYVCPALRNVCCYDVTGSSYCVRPIDTCPAI